MTSSQIKKPENPDNYFMKTYQQDGFELKEWYYSDGRAVYDYNPIPYSFICWRNSYLEYLRDLENK